MTKSNKPVKRNINLVVFSHEHHHALLFCSRLKMANHASEQILKRYVNDFWKHHPLAHFEREETYFLPLMSEHPHKQQFLNEHKQIKNLARLIVESNISVYDLVSQFGKLLTGHIRFEERLMFPWLEQILKEDELEAIGKVLSQIKAESHHFHPEFWNGEK